MSLTTHKDGSTTLNKARHMVCLEAAWEIEAIALMLPDAVENTGVEALQSMLRVRCMAGRLRELANALMAGLGDGCVPVEGLGGLSLKVLLCED